MHPVLQSQKSTRSAACLHLTSHSAPGWPCQLPEVKGLLSCGAGLHILKEHQSSSNCILEDLQMEQRTKLCWYHIWYIHVRQYEARPASVGTVSWATCPRKKIPHGYSVHSSITQVTISLGLARRTPICSSVCRDPYDYSVLL